MEPWHVAAGGVGAVFLVGVLFLVAKLIERVGAWMRGGTFWRD